MASERRLPAAIVYVHTTVAGDEAAAALRLLARIAQQWAETNGYAIDRVMADAVDRSQLREALEEVRRGRVQAIAIPSAETLGGSFGAAVLLALNSTGGVLLSAREKMTATGLFNR